MSGPAPTTPRYSLRAAVDGDRAFLAALYASTRAEELAPVPWSDEQKRRFLESQFELQDHEYRRAYPAGDFLVIEVEGRPAGRLYTNRREGETRIIDLALVPELRGRGLGGAILATLTAAADAEARRLSIHVERFNTGALRLYERLGFRLAEDKGVYLLLAREPVRRAVD